MLARLGQSHFSILPATADSATAKTSADRRGDAGFDVRLVGRDVLVTSVEAAAPRRRPVFAWDGA